MAGRKPISGFETKEQKFRRLALYRTNLAIKEIRKIGNLSNRNNYSYSYQDVESIFAAIKKALNETESLFTARQKVEFRF
jgi:hypothetical protein